MSFCGNFIGFKCSYKNASGCSSTWRRLDEAHRSRNLKGGGGGGGGDGTNGCSVYYDAHGISLSFSQTVPDTSYLLGSPSINLSWAYSSVSACTVTTNTQTFLYTKAGTTVAKPIFLTQTGNTFVLAKTEDAS